MDIFCTPLCPSSALNPSSGILLEPVTNCRNAARSSCENSFRVAHSHLICGEHSLYPCYSTLAFRSSRSKSGRPEIIYSNSRKSNILSSLWGINKLNPFKNPLICPSMLLHNLYSQIFCT